MSTRRRVSRSDTRRVQETFDASAANREMAEKLHRAALRRRARSLGFELRQSSYGYALIDSDRQRVEGRNDLTLDEVAGRLGA